MAGFRNMVLVIGCLLAAMAAVDVASADNYTVGNEMGWTIPAVGDIMYKTWAATKDFELGDTIVFNWNGTHDVAEVSQTDYSSCSKTNPIGTIQTTSPATVQLNSNVTSRYFICTISDHCERGQKVTISIGAASSLTVGAFSLFCSAIVLALLSHLN